MNNHPNAAVMTLPSSMEDKQPYSKSSSACAIIGSLSLLLLMVWYATIDIQYAYNGRVVDGNITSCSQEFAGFTNDNVSGTKPKYRYHITYSYDIDGVMQHGESATMSPGLTKRTSIPIQYMLGNPETHRVLTPRSRWLRGSIYLILLISIAFTAWSGFGQFFAAGRKNIKNRNA